MNKARELNLLSEFVYQINVTYILSNIELESFIGNFLFFLGKLY